MKGYLVRKNILEQQERPLENGELHRVLKKVKEKRNQKDY